MNLSGVSRVLKTAWYSVSPDSVRLVHTAKCNERRIWGQVDQVPIAKMTDVEHKL